MFFDATYPKARKARQCDLCFRLIAVGENYRRQGSVYDGRMHTNVCCLQCEAFAKAVYRLGFEGDEGGWFYLPDLDGGDMAYVGMKAEYDLFRRQWKGDNGALVEPISTPLPQDVGSDL